LRVLIEFFCVVCKPKTVVPGFGKKVHSLN